MRLLVIAAAEAAHGSKPSVGERDAGLVRDRFALGDLGFRVVSLDPRVDLAEQLDLVLAKHAGEVQGVLLYASALVAVVDGAQGTAECFLCLDPDHPDVGDSLLDVRRTLASRVDGEIAVVLEARVAGESSGLGDLQGAAQALQRALSDGQGGVESAVAVRAAGAQSEAIPSRLTAAVLETLDDHPRALTLQQAYAQAVQRGNFAGAPSAVLFAPGARGSFVLRQPPPPTVTREDLPAEPASVRGDEKKTVRRRQSAAMTARITPPVADSLRAVAPEPLPASVRRVSQPPPRAPLEAFPSLELPELPGAMPLPGWAIAGAPALAAETRGLAAETPAAAAETRAPAGVALSTQELVAEPQLPRVEAAPSPTPEPAPNRQPELMVPQAPPSQPRRMAAPRRAAPPSERAEAVSIVAGRAGRTEVASELPKVVISAKVDSRRRRTAPRSPAIDQAIEALMPSRSSTNDAGGEKGAGATPAEIPSAIEAAVPEQEAVPPPPQAPDVPPPAVEPSPSVPAEPAVVALEAAPSVPAEPAVVAPEALLSVPAEPAVVAPAEAVLAPVPVRPLTVEEHLAESDAMLARGELEEAQAALKMALGKLGTSTAPLRGEIYLRVADVQRRQQNPRLAISNYEKALSILPHEARALVPLVELFAELGNWRAIPPLEEKLLSAAGLGDEQRLAQWLASGDRWQNAGSDAARAVERFSDARRAFPRHREPLERLLAVFEGKRDVDKVIATRRDLADLTEDLVARARQLAELADYCLRDGEHEAEALQALELALDGDPSRLDVLEVLANTLAENQEWAELERIYEKVSGAYGKREDAAGRTVHAQLLRKLALLYRDHLEDPTSALGAIDREIALSGDALGAHLLGAEIGMAAGDDPGRVLRYLRAAAACAPDRLETYGALFRLGQKHGEPETSFLAASVQVALGAASDEAKLLHRRHQVETVPQFKRALDDESWAWLRAVAVSHHAASDADVDRVMRAIAPAVVRVRILQLETSGALVPLPGQRQDPESSTVTAVRSLGWAAKQLGVPLPAVHIDEKTDGAIEPRLARHQAVVVGRGALSRRTVSELAFLAARHLALRIGENELIAHCRSVTELSVCLLAGMKLVLGAAPASASLAPSVDALAALLGTQLTDDERNELEAAVRALAARGGELDLLAWGAAVERCATRAGLLMSGNLEAAVGILRAEGDTPFSSATDKVYDLCAFSVGAEYTKLRQRLGVSLVR